MGKFTRLVLPLSSVVFLLSACGGAGAGQDSTAGQDSRLGIVSDPQSPPPPPPPPPPNYAPAIEAALLVDDGTVSHGVTQARVDAMRAIDVSRTPTDFREAYLEHIFAWERRVRAERAWRELTSDENTGPVVIGGIVCAAIGCERNPIDTRVEAEERLKAEIRAAQDQVSSTFQDVQRIAVRYGASATPAAQGTGNSTGM